MISDPHFEYLLHLADNPLILGQRLCEWCGHGPVLEEDLALSNVALDLIGQARLLYAHAGRLEGKGRGEDALAFLRDERDYRNLTMLELPNGDFGRTVLRNFLFSAYQVPLWEGLAASRDAELASVAGKSVKEARYHRDHAADWVVRLGDGTTESHARMQAALDELWPYTQELFQASAGDEAMAAQEIGVLPASLQPAWRDTVHKALSEATLQLPAPTQFRARGKLGVHSEHFGHLLAEMQYLQRSYPGAQW